MSVGEKNVIVKRVKVVYEVVHRSAESSFGLFRFSGKAFQAPYHRHSEVEITFIASGRGELVVGDHIGRFQPGDVIIQGPDLPHSYRSEPGGRAVSFYAQFREDAFGDGFWHLPECRQIRGLLQRAKGGLCLSPKVAGRVGPKLETLFNQRGADRLIGLLDILEDAARDKSARRLAGAGYTANRPAKTTAIVEKILLAVDRGWSEPLRLTDLARSIGLQPQSLSRFCRRQLRCSFQAMLIQRRLAESARQLLESDDSIAQVAFACGFNNLSNFNRLFRRAYKISPSEFRRDAAGE